MKTATYFQEYYQEHKEHIKEQSRRYKQEHPEATKACWGSYYQTHKQDIIKRASEWQKTEKGKVCQKKYYDEHKDYRNEYGHRYYIKIKREVLTHYGNGKLGCVRCGESRLACLSIDHIQGGGLKHRRQLGNKCAGIGFYLWLRKNKFLGGYQTLCMNCQFTKRVENNELYKAQLPAS